jgi:alkylhydroperoxidase family enzyme
VTEAQLNALAEYEKSVVFSAQEKAVLRFADALTSTPANVSDALFAELSSYFKDEQLMELANAIAWENYRARFNRAFDVESQEFSHGAYCPMPVR